MQRRQALEGARSEWFPAGAWKRGRRDTGGSGSSDEGTFDAKNVARPQVGGVEFGQCLKRRPQERVKLERQTEVRDGAVSTIGLAANTPQKSQAGRPVGDRTRLSEE